MSKAIKVLSSTVGGLAALTIIGGILSVEHDNANRPIPIEENVISSDKAQGVDQVEKNEICDGEKVKSNCYFEDIKYEKYIYHPAVAEVSREETVTTYRQEITGYCTLCADGTFSPSCATGRGACSHHGGVAQWNAPRYSNVPVHETRKVIVSPASDEYYEKVVATSDDQSEF